MDAKSLEFLDGSTLDFVKEGLKQVFKFDNPNVDATCGCGESFQREGEGVKRQTQRTQRTRKDPEPDSLTIYRILRVLGVLACQGV